ncbi:MAG: HDIG domain-containing protein, partial [Planctomycetes bacterium]|nr:HDIG domain-containing protein [Planctomycetota bacterium]
MSLFGHKKKKTSRTVALPSASPLKGWFGETLHNRSLLGRLSLCFLAIAAMLCAVQGWRTEFPYRLGDRANRAITAKIKFEIFNQSETDRKKSQAAELVPPVFSHIPNPNLFSNLSAKLRANLGEVLRSESAQDLSAETQSAFGLTVPQKTESNSAPAPENMDSSFNSLKLAIKRAIANSGEQTDTLIVEFERMIKSLNQFGLVSPEELSRNKITFDQLIRVVSATNPKEPQDLLASDVLLQELLKETGRLGGSWSDYINLSKIRLHLERWLMSQMQSTSTLQYDKPATEAALEEAQNRDENIVYDYYNAGGILVEQGKLIDEDSLTILQEEYRTIQMSLRPVESVMRSGIVFFMLLLLAVLNGFYLVRNEPQLVKSAGRLGLFLGLLVFTVGLSRFLWFDKSRAEIIPLLATVMVFAIVYNQKLATITALTLSLIVTLSTSGDLAQFVVLMSVAVTAVIPLNQVSARSSLIKVGFLTGALYFLISWGTGVIQSQSISELWLDTNLLESSLWGAFWCLVVGYLVAGSLPFIEPAFGMVTDMSLLELGEVSHPLLQELVRRAPGTYNHSMSVATIGETAADLIGANGLLVRVGAYFHDIGKMLKPQYFVEN